MKGHCDSCDKPAEHLVWTRVYHQKSRETTGGDLCATCRELFSGTSSKIARFFRWSL